MAAGRATKLAVRTRVRGADRSAETPHRAWVAAGVGWRGIITVGATRCTHVAIGNVCRGHLVERRLLGGAVVIRRVGRTGHEGCAGLWGEQEEEDGCKVLVLGKGVCAMQAIPL